MRVLNIDCTIKRSLMSENHLNIAAKREALSAVSVALAVIAGAFGAHALKGRIEPNLLEAFKTGALYHLLMAIGLYVIAGRNLKSFKIIYLSHLIFSLSLYSLALTGISVFGAITPLGGIGLILGWLMLAWERFTQR